VGDAAAGLTLLRGRLVEYTHLLAPFLLVKRYAQLQLRKNVVAGHACGGGWAATALEELLSYCWDANGCIGGSYATASGLLRPNTQHGDEALCQAAL
jgi:hypothetical protein